ncbi:MAG TPA: hypothetical protein VNP90_01460 [Actinomycetota bacterium]|nr:hypothetical protein [Actinomycetota bacterium]
MVEPADVWMVHLGGRSKPLEVRGTLTLGENGLEFVERKTGADVGFDYRSIRRAKRIKGSPVLLVDWRKDGEDRKTAFYFSQPPPLEGMPRSPTLDPRGPLGPFTRATPSKRQVARMNLGYLRSTSATNKRTLRAWAEAVSERTGRAD